MPTLQQAIVKNRDRITHGGDTKTGIGPEMQTPIIVAPTPPQDLPAGGGVPQRGMFPANVVLASDRSDSSRAFRGQGTRSAAFPYPDTGIKTAPTTIVSATAASVVPVPTTSNIQILVNGA